MVNVVIEIEVAYALPDRQVLVGVVLADNGSVGQAIEASGILQQFPEIDLSQQKVGIFSQLCTLDSTLQAGDRVEIYRPLQQDPMAARRGRLQK